MAIQIKMPKLSQTTEDVRFIRWLVDVGDSIKRGDSICEVENDKTTMEVESFESGTVLKLSAQPDEMVMAGSVIALLGKPGEKISEGIEEKTATTESSTASGKAEDISLGRDEEVSFSKDGLKAERIIGPSMSSLPGVAESAQIRSGRAKNGIKATSLVRNIAKKRNIDLARLQGTGPGGLITKKDIEAYMVSGKKEERAAGFELSRNQVLVARNLSRSKTEIPHYYLKCSVFMENLLKWRDTNRLGDGSKVSVYSILIRGTAEALREYPRMNGYFKENKVILFDGINIGFAVTAGDELYVPVVKDADKKSVQDIDREVKTLVAKAQDHGLESRDVSGCSFTITNLGVYQVDEFGAIINPPQAGILAFGRMKKTLHIDEDDAMHIKRVCTVTGSFDHRFINGAQGAAFLEKFKKIIEEGIL
jgi:pyruvate dehydrogenase E2 component (dihydrolipoamide acetyltransferase)